MLELLLLTSESSDSVSNGIAKKRGEKALRLVVSTNDDNDDTLTTKRGSLMISGALLVSDTSEKQVDSIDALFPNGYTSKTVTNLTELRDALNRYLPRLENNDNNEDDRIHSSSIERFETARQERQERKVATVDEMRRFELFRSVIEHEDDLLNHRVSWIILAQSFLMAAYITTNEELNSLRFVTAGVGLLTVGVTLPAILAAGSNIEVQQQVYFRQISSDERCEVLHGHSRDLSKTPTGQEMKERLKEGHVLPNMAFRSRRSVKILMTAVMLGAVQFVGWIFLLIAVMQDWNIEFR
jgi:hypothetical protein